MSSSSTATTPTTTKAPTPPTLPAGVTKTCFIVKRPDFDGYGFNLHSEKVKPGQFIGKVDPKSPAEAAGLKEGDRILEVNGVSIGSETHKQVVARIKAIANEVRLLLIDVDGKGDEAMAMAKAQNGTNGDSTTTDIEKDCSSSCEGTKQEIPGASANISSISMVSTKRVSNASSSNLSSSTLSADVVDRAALPQQNGVEHQSQSHAQKSMAINNNNNNTLITTPPPPPSAAVAMANTNGNNMVYNTSTTATTTTSNKATTNTLSSSSTSSSTATTNGNGNVSPMMNSNSSPTSTTPTPTPTTPTSIGSGSGSGSGSVTGTMGSRGSVGLNLPLLNLTAAEMRAKLASKKKYDPKNESVDLKKKFEIIQKL